MGSMRLGNPKPLYKQKEITNRFAAEMLSLFLFVRFYAVKFALHFICPYGQAELSCVLFTAEAPQCHKYDGS